MNCILICVQTCRLNILLVGQLMMPRNISINVAQLQKCELPYVFLKNESVRMIEVPYIPLPRGFQRKNSRILEALSGRHFETFPLVLQHLLQKGAARWPTCSYQMGLFLLFTGLLLTKFKLYVLLTTKLESFTVPFFHWHSFRSASISPRNSDSSSQK